MSHTPFYSVDPLTPCYPEPDNLSGMQRCWVHVRDTSVVYQTDPSQGTVCFRGILPDHLTRKTPVYLGTRDDTSYYASEVPQGVSLPEGFAFSPVRELSGKVSDSDMAIASYAVRILDFDRSTSFCGSCGSETRPLPTERARACSSCGRIFYPRISPAIIVLVKKGEEVLLARSSRFPAGVFSVIAGFNEPGENLEQTVHREVREEVGLTVQNLRYFGSEPWPFPDSLMIGFVAEHAGGEIRVDHQEIESAGWYTRATLPPFPSKTSISRALIDAWVRREV